MSSLRILLAIVAAGAAVAAAVVASAPVGGTPARPIRAELPRAGAGAGAVGWSWAVGVPGFHAAEERFWNGFVLPESLRARLAASSGGAEVRVLRALTLPRSGGTLALAAASARDGATCLAAAAGDRLPVTFHCMRQVSPAAKASALVAVEVGSPDAATRTGWPLHLLGVARGDVRRIDFVADDGLRWHLYSRERKYLWGTFTLGFELPHAWSGRLVVERAGGARDVVELTSARPGTASFLVMPRAGSR